MIIKSRKNDRISVYVLIANIVTLIAFFMIIIYNDYKNSFLIPLTPVIFLSGLNFFYIKYLDIIKTMVGKIFFIGFFVRMVISPFMLIISEYTTNIVNQDALNYMNKAVLLIIFEYFICLVYILVNKKVRTTAKITSVEKFSSEHMSVVSRLIFYTILGIIILTIIKYPTYLISINNIVEYFTFDQAQRIAKNVAFIQMRNETSRAIYQIFNLCVVFLQVLIPAYLLSKHSEYFMKSAFSKKSKQKGIGFIIMITIVSFSIMTADVANSIYLAIAIIYSIYTSYPNKIKRFIPLICIGGSIVVFLLLIAKIYRPSNQNVNLGELSKLINAYFAGISNMSCGIGVVYENKFLTFIGDITSSIPLLAHFFTSYTKSQNLFNDFLYGYSGKTDQIMPVICYGYHYLGIFAPLFSIWIYKWAFKFEKKFKETDSIFNKVVYSYLMINFAVCPAIYMLTSGLRTYIYSIVFDWIVKSNEKYVVPFLPINKTIKRKKTI